MPDAMRKFISVDCRKAGDRRASFVSLCILAMLAFGAPDVHAQAQRGFTNLGFELPSAGASACSFQIDAAQVPGWETTHPSSGGNACAPNIAATTGPLIEIWSNNFNGVAARQGTQFAELNAQQASRLYQNVCLVTGETVGWTFSHRGRQSATIGDVAEFRIGNTAGTNRVVRALDANDGNPGSATCFANDGSVTANTCARVTTAQWGDYSGSFVWTGAAGVQQIGFEAISSAGGDNSFGNFLDNVQVTLRPFVELAGNSTLTEGGTLTPPQVRVVGTVPAGGMNVQVVLTGTATLNSDYTTASGTTTVTIAVPAGFYDGTTAASQFDVPITGIVDDAVIENNETVVMTVQPSASYLIASTAACGGVPSTTATLTIVDNDIDLATTKTVNNPTPTLGSTVQYTVTYTNRTARPTIAPLTAHDALAAVVDAVPAGLTFTSWTCTASNGASCPGGAVNGTTSGSGAISGNASLPAGNAAAGGTVSYVINATVGTCGSSILNTSTITDPAGFAEGTSVQAGFTSPAPGGVANNTASASILAPCPQLTVSKTASPNPFTVGQPASYTISVQNTGGSTTVGNIVVADTLPTGITLASASGANWSCTGTTALSCTFTGTIAAGGSTTLTLNVTVAATATTGNNSATASGGSDGSCPAAAHCTGSVTTPVTASADIVVAKTGTASIGFGGALVYSVTVHNNGPSAANGTTFTDNLPAGLSGVSGSCAVTTGTATCGTVTVGATTVTSTITTLASGATVTFTINATAPGSGTSITNSATAQPPAGTTDPTPGNNTGTATTTLLQPQLTVTKTATPNPFTVGQAAQYTITVANTGAGPTSGNIVVADTLPTGITLGSTSGANWNCAGTTVLSCTFTGTIAAGGSTQLTLNVNVAANAANGNNSATASGGSDPTCPVTGRCTGTTTVPVNPSADIAVTKSVDNASPNVGENVTYTITATNNGPNNATGVAITDALPSGVLYVSSIPSQGAYVQGTGVWTVGALNNGSSATLQVTVTVLTPGSITNTATKTAGNQFDPNTGNNAGSAMINANPSADLQVTKTVSNPTPNLGTNVTFTITVHNAGPNNATGVVIDDALPLGLNYVSSTTSQGTYNSGTGIWTVGAITSGSDATLTLTATVTLPGDITNIASVAASDQHDPNPANNSSGATENGQSSDIQVIKGVDNANPVRGNTVTFTITATNNGPSNATGVAITDALPAGLTFVSATPAAGTTYNNLTGIWTIGAMSATGPGATKILTIVATVDTDSGFTNTAALSAIDQTDPNPANNSDSVIVTPIASADIEVVKTGPASATAGQTVSYTLAVSNHGPSSAANVSLADPTPAGLTFVSATAPCTGGFPCALGTLANGATTNVTVVFSVPANYAATSIVNTATVSSPTADPTPGNNSSTVTTPTVASANIGVVKTGPANATAGQNVSYTLAVTNNGPSDAQAVSLADPTPAGLTFVSATAPCAGGFPCALGTLANGATTNVTVVFSVPANYAGASIVNTATVSSPTPDPAPGDNSSTVTTPTAASADVSIIKTGPANATAGQNVSYTLALTNNGPSNAQAVSLADPTPAGLTFVSATAPCAGGFPCVLGTLANGATTNVTVVFSVPANYAGASIVNTATVSSPTPDPTPGNNSSTVTTPVAASANISVIKTGPANGTAGQNVSYTLAVTNNGPSNAQAVSLADPTPAGLTFVSATAPCAGGFPCALGTLANGASISVTVTFSVPAGATGPITNIATVTSPTPDPTPGDNTSTVITPVVFSADIEAVKTGPASIGFGGALSYTVVVTNHGPSNANGTTFSDAVPAAITGVTANCGLPTPGAACGAVNVAGNTVTSTITTLPNGGSVTFTINGTAPTSGASVTNSATAQPPVGTTDPTPGNNTGTATTNLLPPQLTVTKSATPTPFVVGQPAQYTIVVQNTGSGTTNAPVTIADNLPGGITLASASGANWTCTGVSALGCTFSGTLVPGATTTLTLNVNVAASAISANNTATASGGGDPSCPATPHCTGTVVVGVAASADIAVAKIVDNAIPNVGENVTFTITATNNGPSNATGVAITDALPSGLAFVSATPSQGTYVSGSGLWTVGALANGANATLQITANVLIPGSLTNTATKTAGDQLDPDTSNNAASAGINAQPSADLQVLKTVDNAVPNLGTNVTFTITVTNAGPNDATGVVISDALPLGLNFVSSTASQGSYNDISGLWTVGAIVHGTSQTLTITATATLPGNVMNNASVSASDQHDPNPANNSSGATVNGQSADIQVIKTVNNNNPVRGDTVMFTITTTNNGPSNATGVAVTDVLPAGLAFVSATPSQGTFTPGTGVWVIGNLAATGPGATVTLTIVATVNTDGGFTNTAAVTAAGQPDPNPANNSSSVVVTPIASADVEVVKTGPAGIVAGQNASYTIAVTNHGLSPAANVSLADPTPAGLTFVSASAPCAGGFPCALGTLNAGQTVNLTVVFAVPAGYAGASVTNTASATSPTQDPNTGNNSSTVITPAASSADIEVVKTGPASATAGQNANYTIAVTNHGPSNALAVSLLDPIPAGLSFVSASAPCAAGFPCALGTVNAGQTVSIAVVFAVPSSYIGANITNIASATSTTPDPTTGNNSSTVVTPVAASADIVVAKTGPSSANSGAAIGYTVVVSNAGPSDANGVSFSDPVPAGITGVSASCGGATAGATCGTVNVAGNSVTSTITVLPAGSSVTFTIGGNAPFGAQTLLNTATAAPPAGVTDPVPANNSSSASTTIGGAADIGLTKNVDNTAPNVGDTVVFTIIATNHGPNDASGVAVTDSLPAGLGFVSAAASQGSYVSASALWTIGNLANGASVTLTITATVDVPGALTNTVAVSASDQPDPDTSNNNAGASINAGATADIGIAKSVDNASPNVGSTVTYTITATNHGPNDATGVEATDHLPAGTSFVAATASQGTYDDVGGVWTIGALVNGAAATLTITVDVDQPGSITNAVTITHEDQFDPVGANNQAGTTINGQQADLAVTKTVDNATPNVGSNVAFTVSVHNNGPSAATNVALSDQLPAGLTFVSATPSQGSYNSTTGIWTVGSLSAAGTSSSATLGIVATVTQAGAMVNTASVIASDQPDPNTTNNSDSASLNGNPQADLVVAKSGPATVTPGANAVYTIVVTNNGPSDATNVVVADATPPGLVFVGNAGACATAYPCTISTLANGVSASITTTYSVPANYAGANPIINTASASSDTPDPDTTNNQSSAQTNVGPGNADLAIVKTGPATVASGASITYTLTITNNGPSPANGAAYSDNVPAGISAITASCGGESGGAACGTPTSVVGNVVSGTVGSLPSGGVVVITINGTAPTGPLALSNTATVQAPAGINDTDPSNNSSTVVTNIGAQSADLSVIKTGPANAAPGTNVTYTLTVTNAGPDGATNVVLGDATPAGLNFVSASLPCQAGFPCALGNLAAGGSTIVSVTFAVPANATGSIVNTATVGSDTPDPNPADNSSTVTTPLVPVAMSADLSVIKTGPANVVAGANAAYTLLVTNNGPDAATGVVLADPTPAGLTFVSADGPCVGGFPCALGTLANGAGVSVNVTFAVSASASGTIVNTASVTSATPDPDGSNNSSTVPTTVTQAALLADLVVIKTGPAHLVAGGSFSYTINVANHGPDAVPDAVLNDPTPPGLTFVSASSPCTGGFPCTIGALANGASVTVTATYTVLDGFAGSVTNIASAHSATVPDPSPNNNSSTVATTITGAPEPNVNPVPVDARWMLALMTLLLVLAGAPLAKRRR